MDLSQQIVHTWYQNHHVNNLFLDEIDEKGMQATLSKRGGRTVLLQLAHLHNVRLMRIEHADKKLHATLSPIDAKALLSKQELVQHLNQSYHAIKTIIENSIENDFKVKGFKTGLIPFIGYFISHESHHRGNILLTLKQNGNKISDRLKWETWNWDKEINPAL